MIYQKKQGCKARGLYEGEWAKDKFNGFGKEGLPNGNIYEGYFKNGLRHGEGLMEYTKQRGTVADGKYQGEWVEGKYNGRGKEKYKNGNIYEGQFKNDKRHGKGRMEYALRAGAKFEGYYEGEWVNGESNGQGKERYPNGNTYRGELKNGERHGKGRMDYLKKPSAKFSGYYDGEWSKGLFDG